MYYLNFRGPTRRGYIISSNRYEQGGANLLTDMDWGSICMGKGTNPW